MLVHWRVLSIKPFHRTQHFLTQQASQALKADFDAEALSLPSTDPAPINKWVDSKTQGLKLGQKRAKRSLKNTCGWLVGWLVVTLLTTLSGLEVVCNLKFRRVFFVWCSFFWVGMKGRMFLILKSNVKGEGGNRWWVQLWKYGFFYPDPGTDDPKASKGSL